MKTNLRRYAPIGLYLALVAALATGGLFIVYKEFNLAIQISLAVMVIGLAAYVLMNPEGVHQALTGRQARYGSNALILTIAFIGILVAGNFLSFKYSPRWDLTENKENSLAPETVDLLNSLPEPVHAQAFFTADYASDTARKLLENFALYGKPNFSYEFIDPDAEPVKAKNANITRNGTIVLSLGDYQEQITYASEEELDKALIRLLNPESRVIYFLTGHGEFDPNGNGDTSYSQAKNALTGRNYIVKSLNLLSDPAIPVDAKLIIIAGPLKPLAQNEVDLIKEYMAKGGSLCVMYEPSILMESNSTVDLLADYLSTDWHVNFGNDIVVDLVSQSPLIAYAASYGNHAITEKMGRFTTEFPTARSVRIGEMPENITLTSLVQTSENSWGETDFEALNNQKANPDEGVDLIGPVTLAVAGTDLSSNAQILVIGDSEYASDQFYQEYGNGDFFVNSVDWAAEQENLINLTSKPATDRFLMPPSKISLGLILLVSIFGLPGLVLLAGLATWIQRRRRG